jgi:tRNA 2-thiocytidine biosynthesis protein TtcA
LSDDKKNIIIRPLAYCREKDIERFSAFKDFPIIPCNLCGSQENLQRKAMKVMLKGWDKQFPGRLETIFTSLQNVAPSQLADKQLFDFLGLTRNAAQSDSQSIASCGNQEINGLDVLMQ